MQLDDFLKIMLPGGSLAAGAVLTALRARLVSIKTKNKLHFVFYILSILIFLGACFSLYKFWNEIIINKNVFAVTVLLFAIASSITLAITTYKFLSGKFEYRSDELNDTVNKFSKNADKASINLLAGNLDFLGKNANEIEYHPQYKCLREINFDQIQILCTIPNSQRDKARYGKIIDGLPSVKLRHYHPVAYADLRVRGRIKTLRGVKRLLIYSKIGDGRYEALELNTADTDGELYGKMWDLLWHIAQEPSAQELQEYKECYEQSIDLL